MAATRPGGGGGSGWPGSAAARAARRAQASAAAVEWLGGGGMAVWCVVQIMPICKLWRVWPHAAVMQVVAVLLFAVRVSEGLGQHGPHAATMAVQHMLRKSACRSCS